MEVKFMDKAWALKANAYAKKRGWKHTIKDEELWRLRDNKILPIAFMIPEDDVKMEITLTLDANLTSGEAINRKLNIPVQLWEKLPSVEGEAKSDVKQEKPPEEGLSDGAKNFLFS